MTERDEGGNEICDVVVVGGGMAGLSAALMLARARRRVVCVDAGAPRNAAASHVHGFLSRDQTSPQELRAAGAGDLAGYGGEIVTGTATTIEAVGAVDAGARAGGAGFLVRLGHGRGLRGRAVVVATGLRDELPAIDGLHRRWGREVLHCPYCHGYEVRDAPVAVIGGANRAFTMHQVQLVRQWTDQVVFAPHEIVLDEYERERLAARGIAVEDSTVAGVTDLDDPPAGAVGVRFVDGRVLARAAVFVGPRFVPRDEMLSGLGCARDDSGAVAVDPTGHTSVAGVWAVGNVVGDTQAIVSAASGVTAGIALNHHLLADDVDRAVDEHRATRNRR